MGCEEWVESKTQVFVPKRTVHCEFTAVRLAQVRVVACIFHVVVLCTSQSSMASLDSAR